MIRAEGAMMMVASTSISDKDELKKILELKNQFQVSGTYKEFNTELELLETISQIVLKTALELSCKSKQRLNEELKSGNA